MKATELELLVRCNRLGIKCDGLPQNAINSAWTDDRPFRVPILDLPGAEPMREAFVIGEQEHQWALERDHRHLLGTLIRAPQPSDRVIYEFAWETLALGLEYLHSDVAARLRGSMHQLVMAVAHASGKGLRAVDQQSPFRSVSA